MAGVKTPKCAEGQPEIPTAFRSDGGEIPRGSGYIMFSRSLNSILRLIFGSDPLGFHLKELLAE